MNKGKRAAERSVSSQKECTRCKTLLLLENFAKAKYGAFGVTSICKVCRIKDRDNPTASRVRVEERERNRIQKLNALLARGRKKSTTCVEDRAVEVLMHVAQSLNLEVRKWHDGTRSDVGVRPLGICIDLWLPLQIKSTPKQAPAFQWNLGKRLYEVPVILITGNALQWFWLSPQSLMRHRDKLRSSGGAIRYGVEDDCYWNRQLTSSAAVDLVRRLKEMWFHHRDAASSSLLADEMTLQMQCSLDSQQEWFVSWLCRKLHADKKHTNPLHQSTIDRYEDDLRIQDKSAHWTQGTPYFKAKCAKLLYGVEVPYFVGDADLFCFAVVIQTKRLLLEWRIPEDIMDAQFGRLAHIKDEMCLKAGRICINLPVVGPSGENMALHKQLFGKMPRKDTDLRPALFLNVHRIPNNVELPECVCGRDPIIVV